MSNNMNLEVLSGSRPVDVITNLEFWRSNIKTVIVLIVCVFTFIILFNLTLPDLKNMDGVLVKTLTTFITIFIWGILIWGLVQIAIVLAKLEIESAYAQVSERKFQKKMRNSPKFILDIKIEDIGTILPDNDNLTMTRLFEHIITEAKARKFESSLITMQPYKEESLGALLKISNLQRIALQLGILGTFIGLILGFKELNFSVSENVEDVMLPLTKALQFSFSTSIAGLQVAVILGAFTIVLREKQEEFFKIMEKATDSILSLARRAENKDEFFVEFQQVRNSINQLTNSIAVQSEEIKHQTAEIQTGIHKLVHTKAEFDGFLKMLASQEVQFLKEIKQIRLYLSPEAISKDYKESLKVNVDFISNAIQDNLDKTLAKYDNLNEVILRMNENIRLIDKQLKEQIDFGNKKVIESREEIYKALESMSKAQEDFVKQVSSQNVTKEIKDSIIQASHDVSKSYKSNLQQLIPEIESLNRELKNYNLVAKEDISKRTPPVIFVQIIQLTGVFFTSIFRWFINTIKFIISTIREK